MVETVNVGADLRQGGNTGANIEERHVVAALAVVIAGLLIWPFTQGLYLPLTDLPNHIARHTIAASQNAGPLSEFWTTHLTIVPNSAVDLLWAILGYPGSAIRFDHTVMMLVPVLLFASGMVLARVVHGRWSLWSLACGIVVFNATYFYGFQNFNFSLPFGILAFALYLHLEDRPLALRVAVFVPIAAILFIMHFFVFAILAVLALGREVQGVVETRRWTGMAMAVPFLIPLAYLAWSIVGGPENPAGSYTEWPSLRAILARFITPLYTWVWYDAHAINPIALGTTAALYLAFLTMLIPGVGLRLAPRMRGPVLALLGVCLISPTWLQGVALIDIRFPFVLMLICIAGSQWAPLSRSRAVTLALVILTVIGLRSAMVAQIVDTHDANIRDLVAVIEEGLEPGDRVIPVRNAGKFGDASHWHAQAYVVPVAGAFMPTLFQGVHSVQLKPEWRDHATPLMHANPMCSLFPAAPIEGRIVEADTRATGLKACWVEPYVEGWADKFTHVLAHDPLEASYLADAPVALVAEQGRYQLYEVIR
ncbi:MAG: hypothetical protein AAFO58_03595 [Pseudomonadota bacterium]